MSKEKSKKEISSRYISSEQVKIAFNDMMTNLYRTSNAKENEMIEHLNEIRCCLSEICVIDHKKVSRVKDNDNDSIKKNTELILEHLDGLYAKLGFVMPHFMTK